eukprot:CAMPEP_0202712930 /NCGR_PEP_ID=MMETSP1385-20130828/47574_1 /ASSEMBLY_ACC=CAM_ASM_000861 /TAXON_ID=933848 /ORGANISM="Elphidium margaritaceum" /LENGTH=182 /DNA_ID=CAMNT_0049373127 /DNA_START=145 /DNA_END=693 /DNA_ORIENTATION=-
MGKKDFQQIYRDLKQEIGGDLTCKISYYSDNFEPNKDFGGVVIYKKNDKAKWKNDAGKLKGHSGRSFYVILQKTNGWDVEQKGTGRMHPFVIENHMGIAKFSQIPVFCGAGFAYHDGKVKYHSIWLNSGTCCNKSYPSDGDKCLSYTEKKLVDHVVEQWKKKGKHSVFDIPYSLDRLLKGQT